MKPLIVYCTIKGHTKRIVNELGFLDSVEAKTLPCLVDYDPILMICPTYGDEELPHEMEDYIGTIQDKDKTYGICELGNYYGYEDFQFGALRIIKYELDALGWKNYLPNLSLDSLPKIDWLSFNKWKYNLYEILNKNTIFE